MVTKLLQLQDGVGGGVGVVVVGSGGVSTQGWNRLYKALLALHVRSASTEKDVSVAWVAPCALLMNCADESHFRCRSLVHSGLYDLKTHFSLSQA